MKKIKGKGKEKEKLKNKFKKQNNATKRIKTIS
jgi:hypothetical protein